MSALTAWERPVAPRPGSATDRPQLTLVDGGSAAPRTSRRLRLTRRGRFVLSLAAAVVVLVVGGLVTRVASADAAAGRTVVVPAGSTLSEVAAHELPDRSVAQGVADIQRANGLTTDQVSAGQVLSIPVG